MLRNVIIASIATAFIGGFMLTAAIAGAARVAEQSVIEVGEE